MKGIVLLLLMSISSILHAENNLKFIMSGGITSGGDTLARTTAGSSLKSGGLIMFSFGGLYEFDESDFQLQTSFGYHFDSLNADNGSADFDRYYLEIIPFYRVNETVRIGMGYARFMSVSYSDPFDSIDFKDANGLVTEINWNTQSNVWWGLRYVQTEYIINSINGFKVGNAANDFPLDGDYFGVTFHVAFR